jgi:hypothetical protein
MAKIMDFKFLNSLKFTEFISLFNGKTCFGWMFSVLKIFPKNYTMAGNFVCYKHFSVC